MDELAKYAFLLLEIIMSFLSGAFFLPRGIRYLSEWKKNSQPEKLSHGIVCCLAAFFLISSFWIYIFSSFITIWGANERNHLRSFCFLRFRYYLSACCLCLHSQDSAPFLQTKRGPKTTHLIHRSCRCFPIRSIIVLHVPREILDPYSEIIFPRKLHTERVSKGSFGWLWY